MGKVKLILLAFIPELHILHISCDIILNIFSVIIMLDIVIMQHYIHKQPYSIICNIKYIVGKSSMAMLLLIYTAWKLKIRICKISQKWPSIHSVVLYFPNNKNQILGYEFMVILLYNIVWNYLNFCFFTQC